MNDDKISNDVIMEIMMKSIPYPDQIMEIDSAEANVVRFTWRSRRYRVSGSTAKLFVETVRDIFLEGSDISILMQALLNRQYVQYFINKEIAG